LSIPGSSSQEGSSSQGNTNPKEEEKPSDSGSQSGSQETAVSGKASLSADIKQSGVGSRSRLSEITSASQIARAITVSNAAEFKAALTKVSAGGAIILSKGTYSFSETVTIPSSNNGTSSAMKYVMAAPGSSPDQVILDFSGQTLADSNRGIQLFGDYWHFYGLTVKGAGDNGMYVSGNNNIVENCIFAANRDTGLQIARESSSMASMSDWPANNLILNCTSYDNADKTGENADGFACKLTAGNGNVFDGCIAYSNSDDGWDLYAKEATGSIGVVTIRNCVAFNNGKLTTGSSYGNGDMNGFKLGGSNGKVPTAHVVTNSLAFANGHDGFTDNGNGAALNVSNCTSYNNAKVNFNFYRTNKGVFTGLVTGSPNSSDKYGTSSVASTLSKSLYFTNSKYYWISSPVSVTNGQKNIGSQVNAPSFKSTSLPSPNSSIHKTLRNSDGSVNMGSLFAVNDSNYIGARFSNQADSVKGISLLIK
ncbi:MAG: right-handed parallel beta-helix repeat-containing protein, partial [Treponema sp.]|nr:right-handed parallel beta-helix repeat-containing protein [Treponema sp.]